MGQPERDKKIIGGPNCGVYTRGNDLVDSDLKRLISLFLSYNHENLNNLCSKIHYSH